MSFLSFFFLKINPLIQSVLKQAGGKGIAMTFLITDSQIKNERFLEDIDALLNSGEVPNLFASDEKAEIMEVCVLHIHKLYT